MNDRTQNRASLPTNASGRLAETRDVTLDKELEAHIDAMRGTVDGSSKLIADIAHGIRTCFEAGGKLLICGNGGSAADAQHFAAEFVNHLRFDRPGLPAIALSTDTSILTAVANDRRYEDVFARQVEALGSSGDVLIALSTSGASQNVLIALDTARRLGLVTIGFTGEAGVDRMSERCDLVLVAASTDTARIQECHEFVYHVVAGMVEQDLFGDLASEKIERARSR